MDYRYVKSINNTTTILRMCVVSSIQIVASIYLQRSKYVTNSVSDVTPVAGLHPSTAYYTNNPPLCAQCDNIFILYQYQCVSTSTGQHNLILRIRQSILCSHCSIPIKNNKKTGLAQSAT